MIDNQNLKCYFPNKQTNKRHNMFDDNVDLNKLLVVKNKQTNKEKNPHSVCLKGHRRFSL